MRAAGIQWDVLNRDVVVTEGVDRTTDLLNDMAQEPGSPMVLDLLFCEGCIKGPFAGAKGVGLSYKQAVVDYANEVPEGTGTDLSPYEDLDLGRAFTNAELAAPKPAEPEIRAILAQTNKVVAEDELNCGACGYPSCRDNAIAVYQGLAEAEMCLPYLIDKLERTITELATSRRELVEAEEQLIHSEKLASMGQLAAGVAHEINNPLGTVLIYSHMLLKELQGDDPHRQDAEMISREAERCRRIVANLLDFARQSKVQPCLTDLHELLRETVELVSKHESFARVRVITDFSPDLPEIEIDREQIKQALLNILTNAGEAMPEGGELRVTTEPAGEQVRVFFRDTGCGIAEENLERIFDPFFTTKQIGKGTGLGLAITYGIVKMHRGDVSVDSRLGEGTTFVLTLPTHLPHNGGV